MLQIENQWSPNCEQDCEWEQEAASPAPSPALPCTVVAVVSLVAALSL